MAHSLEYVARDSNGRVFQDAAGQVWTAAEVARKAGWTGFADELEENVYGGSGDRFEEPEAAVEAKVGGGLFDRKKTNFETLSDTANPVRLLFSYPDPDHVFEVAAGVLAEKGNEVDLVAQSPEPAPNGKVWVPASRTSGAELQAELRFPALTGGSRFEKARRVLAVRLRPVNGAANEDKKVAAPWFSSLAWATTSTSAFDPARASQYPMRLVPMPEISAGRSNKAKVELFIALQIQQPKLAGPLEMTLSANEQKRQSVASYGLMRGEFLLQFPSIVAGGKRVPDWALVASKEGTVHPLILKRIERLPHRMVCAVGADDVRLSRRINGAIQCDGKDIKMGASGRDAYISLLGDAIVQITEKNMTEKKVVEKPAEKAATETKETVEPKAEETDEPAPAPAPAPAAAKPSAPAKTTTVDKGQTGSAKTVPPPPPPRKVDASADVSIPPVAPPAIGPPAIGPPAIGPPAIGPPAIGPPAIGPPAIGPPAIGPPAIGPPAIGPPAIGPPAVGPLKAGPPKAAPEGRSGLLSQIQQGMALRKTPPKDIGAKVTSSSGPASMVDALRDRLAQRGEAKQGVTTAAENAASVQASGVKSSSKTQTFTPPRKGGLRTLYRFTRNENYPWSEKLLAHRR